MQPKSQHFQDILKLNEDQSWEGHDTIQNIEYLHNPNNPSTESLLVNAKEGKNYKDLFILIKPLISDKTEMRIGPDSIELIDLI